MVELVSPVFHKYVIGAVPPDAHASNANDEDGALQVIALIVTDGLGFTITVAWAEQPFTPVGETTTAVSLLVVVPVEAGVTLRVQLNPLVPRVKVGHAAIPAATSFSHPPEPVGDV